MNQRIHKSFKLNGVSHNEQSLLKKITSNKDLLFLKSLIASWFATNNYLEVKTSGSTGNPKKIKIPKDICQFDNNQGPLEIDSTKLSKRPHERLEILV